MKKKGLFGVCICILILLSTPAFAANQQTNEGKVECYVSNVYEMKKINEKEMPFEKLEELEEKISNILNSNENEMDEAINETLELLSNANILPDISAIFGKEWGWGIFNYVISYGRGEIYIPFKSDRSFLRLLLRPIFFKYNIGFTMTKFGATYMWDSNGVVGNMGFMLGRQRGFMVGFVGLHIRIPHKLNPDGHLFIGAAIMINGNNLLF